MTFDCPIIMVCASETWCRAAEITLFINSIKHWTAWELADWHIESEWMWQLSIASSDILGGKSKVFLYQRINLRKYFGCHELNIRLWKSWARSVTERFCEAFVCILNTRIYILPIFFTSNPEFELNCSFQWALRNYSRCLFSYDIFVWSLNLRHCWERYLGIFWFFWGVLFWEVKRI